MRTVHRYLYTHCSQIFVSMDEHTTVEDLAGLLRYDLQLVKDAVSAYCRLGFAFKKGTDAVLTSADWHPSWREARAAGACVCVC